jgi:hypothetical protein
VRIQYSNNSSTVGGYNGKPPKLPLSGSIPDWAACRFATYISGSSSGRIKVFETLHLGSNPRPETWAFSLMVKCNVDIVKSLVRF